MHWSSSSSTDPGRVREHNEDACLERGSAGLWVVADGMGGHAAGDVASSMIVETLAAFEPADDLAGFLEQVEDRLEHVNADLRHLASARAKRTIGSTVVALLARGDLALCLWAGDSRAYRLRDGQLEQLTEDHGLVADLVARGLLSADQAAHHPFGNLVTRAVGGSEGLVIDMDIFDVRDGDRFLLCSDGLVGELSAAEIRDLLDRRDVADPAAALVELALARGARDNVTVIVTDAHANAPPEPPPRSDFEDTHADLAPFRSGPGRAP